MSLDLPHGASLLHHEQGPLHWCQRGAVALHALEGVLVVGLQRVVAAGHAAERERRADPAAGVAAVRGQARYGHEVVVAGVAAVVVAVLFAPGKKIGENGNELTVSLCVDGDQLTRLRKDEMAELWLH